MSLRITLMFAAGLLLVVLSSPAHAQGPPGGPPGPSGPGGPSLIMAAPIQKELGLNDKQKTQLKKLDATASQKSRKAFEAMRQGDFDPEKMRESMDSLRRDQELAISKILEPKQKTRLGEIELQREGIFAVARTDIAKKLNLTSTQTDQIKTIVDQMRKDVWAAMPRPPEGSQAPGRVPPGGGSPPGGNGFQGGGPPDGGGPPGEGVFPGGGPPGSDVPLDEGVFPGDGPPGGGGPPGDGGFQGGGPPGGGQPGFGRYEFRAQFDKMRRRKKRSGPPRPSRFQKY